MYTLGTDIGSTFSKVVILQGGAVLAAYVVEPLGTGTVGPEHALKKVFELYGLSQQDISYTVMTGHGRMNCDCADEQISGLSCHAKGVHLLLPTVYIVIDTDGQDAKALSITDKGQPTTFQMNGKYTAGTGRFLDVMARVLNVEISELGPLSQESSHPVGISDTCTVFAEPEVILQLSSNIPIEDTVAGIHSSVARHVADMSPRLDRTPDVAMSEGVALSIGVVHAMEQEMGCHILVGPLYQSMGTIGAAVPIWEKRKEGKVDDHE